MKKPHFVFLIALIASLASLLGGCAAQELSHRAYSAANMTGVMKGALVYANDNAGNLPEHPAQLVAAAYSATKQYINPRTGNAPLKLEGNDLEAAKKDWHALAAKLDAHDDYVWAFGGLTYDNAIEADLIAGWEKPEGLKDGITLAFGDAHAEFVKFADVPAKFEKSNEIRKQKKLPLIEMKDGLPVAPK